MGKRLYPHNRLKYWWCYNLDEICDVFKDTGLHIQTVRKWIVKEGLSPIDRSKPTLVYGYDLITFLKRQNDKGKCKTEFDQFYCMSCKDARPIFQGKVSLTQKPNGVCARGYCRSCKSTMNKTYKFDDFQKLKRLFHVVDVLQLYDCEESSVMTHIDDCIKNTVSDSYQGDLFE